MNSRSPINHRVRNVRRLARFPKSDSFKNSASHSGGSPAIVIVPGAIAFTRHIRGQRLRQTLRQHHQASFRKPNAKYTRANPAIPPVSAKFTIDPFERRSIGAAACAQKNGAFTFVSSDASQIAAVSKSHFPQKICRAVHQ